MMPTTRDARPFELGGRRRELVRLVRQIQALTLELQELQELQQREADTQELHAKERAREQLLWQLAAIARRTAANDLGSAA